MTDTTLQDAINSTTAPATKATRKPRKARSSKTDKVSKTKGKVSKGKDKAKAKKSAGGSVIPPEYAATYHRDPRVKTVGGSVAVDNNDTTAKKLRGKPLDEVYATTAKALGVTAKSLKEQYGHLNLGMQRMTLGNRLRAAK